MSAVETLVTVDDQHRFETVTDDLDDLVGLQNVPWHYDLPTICLAGVPVPRIVSKPEFFKALNSSFPLIQRLSADVLSNVMFAGGAILGCLTQGGPDQCSDLDMFLYGLLSEEAAIQKMEQIVTALVQANSLTRKRSYSWDLINVYWNTYSVNVLVDHQTKYQIIPRLYKTESAVLHGFDLPCCAVGYIPSTKRLFATGLGRFCIEKSINIFRPSRSSVSCGGRLQKYISRGYRLVLPHLDYDQAMTTDTFRIGKDLLEFEIDRTNPVIHNRVLVRRVTMLKERPSHDYDDSLPADIGGCSFNWANLYRLGSKSSKFGLWSETNSWSTGSHFSDFPLAISEDLISHYYRNLSHHLATGRDLNVSFMLGSCRDVIGPLKDMLFSTTATYKQKEDYFHDLCEKQCTVVLLRLTMASQEPRPVVQTSNPMTQFTGSFNPTPQSAQEFYGTLFRTGCTCPE